MPSYRPGNQTRRAGRAQIDHDVFEGLPVRNWRRQAATVGGPQKVEEGGSSEWPPELPMPRDAHMLGAMSRALLQAARAGRVNKAPTTSSGEEDSSHQHHSAGATTDETEDAATAASAAAGAKSEEEAVGAAFQLKRWQLLPRHLEGSEVEYLAKPRKGLRKSNRNGGILGPAAGGAVVKRTTVRRVDGEGNSSVEEVLVTEGQHVDGEVIAEVAMTDAGAPGTVVEGVGVVNADGVVVATEPVAVVPTPPRRRPPPPRRKAKGFKGRKKKVQFFPDSERPNGQGEQPNGVTTEGDQGHAQHNGESEQNGGDVEMGDDSNMQDGDEDDDEGEGEGEDGDEGEGEEGEGEGEEEGQEQPGPPEIKLVEAETSQVEAEPYTQDAETDTKSEFPLVDPSVPGEMDTREDSAVEATEDGVKEAEEPVPGTQSTFESMLEPADTETPQIPYDLAPPSLDTRVEEETALSPPKPDPDTAPAAEEPGDGEPGDEAPPAQPEIESTTTEVITQEVQVDDPAEGHDHSTAEPTEPVVEEATPPNAEEHVESAPPAETSVDSEEKAEPPAQAKSVSPPPEPPTEPQGEDTIVETKPEDGEA